MDIISPPINASTAAMLTVQAQKDNYNKKVEEAEAFLFNLIISTIKQGEYKTEFNSKIDGALNWFNLFKDIEVLNEVANYFRRYGYRVVYTDNSTEHKIIISWEKQ